MQNNNVYEYINITNVLNQLNIKKTSTKGIYMLFVHFVKIQKIKMVI